MMSSDPMPRRLLAALILVLCAAATGDARAQAAAGRASTDWAPPGWRPGAPAPASAPIAEAGAGAVLVAARSIPSRTVLGLQDVELSRAVAGPGLSDPAQVVGQETRVALYPGRPIQAEDIGPPALVERNELILLRYTKGPLLITVEGRALDRGAHGERIRATNLGSRQTVIGRVAHDGALEVSP